MNDVSRVALHKFILSREAGAISQISRGRASWRSVKQPCKARKSGIHCPLTQTNCFFGERPLYTVTRGEGVTYFFCFPSTFISRRNIFFACSCCFISHPLFYFYHRPGRYLAWCLYVRTYVQTYVRVCTCEQSSFFLRSLRAVLSQINHLLRRRAR